MKTPLFTSRQTNVLVMICQEQSRDQICRRLGIAVGTYAHHRESVLKKTKSKSNIGIFRFALVNKIVRIVNGKVKHFPNKPRIR